MAMKCEMCNLNRKQRTAKDPKNRDLILAFNSDVILPLRLYRKKKVEFPLERNVSIEVCENCYKKLKIREVK